MSAGCYELYQCVSGLQNKRMGLILPSPNNAGFEFATMHGTTCRVSMRFNKKMKPFLKRRKKDVKIDGLPDDAPSRM